MKGILITLVIKCGFLKHFRSVLSGGSKTENNTSEILDKSVENRAILPPIQLEFEGSMLLFFLPAELDPA